MKKTTQAKAGEGERPPRPKRGPCKARGETGPNTKESHAFTEKRQARYLRRLAETGLKTKSARYAGVVRATVFGLRERDPIFAELEAEALEVYADRLREEGHRRAVEGWKEAVFYQGAKCGTVQKYSDQLLLAFLKRHDPEFRESYRHDVGGRIDVGLEPIRELPRETREALRGLLRGALTNGNGTHEPALPES